MPEKACQNPLTSPVWPKKGSCSPGDSSHLPHFGKGRGSVFLKWKNRNARKWAGEKITPREAMCQARGQRGLSWTPVESERGGDGRRSRGNVSCLIGECMAAGRRGSCWRKGNGPRRVAGRGEPGRFREGASGGIVPENCFEEGARGGRVRRDKGDSGKGRAVASSRRIASRKGAGGGRARQETTRRKKCRAKRKRRPGPPYLWYLEFCKIWKPR